MSEIMNTHFNPFSSKNFDLRIVAGATLILAGSIVLIDQSQHTGWLTFVILPILGFVSTVRGFQTRNLGWLITGSLVMGVGAGGFLALSPLVNLSVPGRVGAFLCAFALGWASISVFSALASLPSVWWPLLPAGALSALGICLMFTQLRLIDFELYVITTTGILLLGSGVYYRLFGLVIPGCLLSAIGPGIYLAWSGPITGKGLTETGEMLVVFAVGWILITLFSRIIWEKFVWWPLIPGGMMAMVGWGLYIGGSPSNALTFIGNTGSVGLIIIGVYLLLMRKSIQK